jgi:multidrug efflux pump subunit AcrA (membrane-fusion protein)
VPAGAVQADGETGVVFVIRDDVVERRAVRLGQREGDQWVVLSGVSSGARLAVGDFSKLVDGVHIRIED